MSSLSALVAPSRRTRAQSAVIVYSVFILCLPVLACAPHDGPSAPSPDDGASARSLDAAVASTGDTPAEAPAASRMPDARAPLGLDAAADSGGGWTFFGHDFENTQRSADEHLVRASNVAQLAERWRFRVPDGASSTPVVHDGTAYFGAWDGFLYAVHAETGELRWRQRVAVALVRGTPLVTADRVYVAGFSSLAGLERSSGKLLFSTVLDPLPLALIDSSPKLVDGMLLIGVASGDNSVPSDKGYTFQGAVVAVDAETGELVWRVATTGTKPGPCTGGAGAGVWSSAAIDPELGLAYFGTGQGYQAPASTCSDSLIAIHYRRDHPGERIAWVAQYTAGDVFVTADPVGSAVSGGLDGDVGASPNLFVANGTPLVGAGDKNGSYRVFDRRTGAQVWRKDLAMGIRGLGGVMTTAAFDGSTLYVASNRFQALDYPILGSPSRVDIAILYALDAATGSERWTVELPSPMVGGFAIANGLLYHAIIDGTLYARELGTGRVLWMSKLEGTPGSAPSIVDGRLFQSAGMTVVGAGETGGGVVSCFALGSEPRTEWVAPEEVLAPLSTEQCQGARHLAPDLRSELGASCVSCLCACDATASGYADIGMSLAPCVKQSCSLAAPGDDMRTCMGLFCSSKLLTTYLFDRAVAVAPCMLKCADSCEF